jgi:hypothetical protein
LLAPFQLGDFDEVDELEEVDEFDEERGIESTDF